MINVGTVGAYLTLSTTEFHNGIGKALTDLARLEDRTKLSASVFSFLRSSMGTLLLGGVIPLSAALFANGEKIGAFAGKVKSYLSALTSGYSSAGSRISAVTAGIVSGVSGPLTGLVGTARRIMGNVGDGMLSGLSGKAYSIIEKARSIANSVSSVMRSALRINSPSKVTRELGYQTGLGFELGLEDTRRGVEEKARELSVSGFAARSLFRSPPSAALSEGSRTPDSRVERQLDRILRLLEDSGQVMQVDGRTFGRLIREYI